MAIHKFAKPFPFTIRVPQKDLGETVIYRIKGSVKSCKDGESASTRAVKMRRDVILLHAEQFAAVSAAIDM